VTWSNPPPAGADFCGSYGRVVRINMPWGGFLDTHANGGFPGDAVLVARFTVPQNASGISAGVASVVEFIDPQAMRQMTLSPSACDFRGFTPNIGGTVDPEGIKNPLAWGYGINPNVFFGLPNSANRTKLEPGRTYYINIRNRDLANKESCQGASCNIRMTLNPPR
jgi:hypothetical protein